MRTTRPLAVTFPVPSLARSTWHVRGRRTNPLARHPTSLAASLAGVLLGLAAAAAGCTVDDRVLRASLKPDGDSPSGGPNFLYAYPLHHSEPDWSPHGLIAYRDEGVVFVATGGAAVVDPSLAGIYVLNPITGVSNKVLEYGGQPSWSPDGLSLCFGHLRRIYSVRTDGTNLHTIASDGSFSFPRWSPDGSRILFDGVKAGESGYDLFSADTLGAGMSHVCGQQPGRRSPAWSSDGSSVAFSMSGLGSQPDLYAVAVGNCATTRITKSATDDRDPSCSPNGKWIAYTAVNHGTAGPPQLHVASIDGSEDIQVTMGGGSWPSWSPDSKKLVYVRENPADSSTAQGVLWILDLASQTNVQLTFQRGESNDQASAARPPRVPPGDRRLLPVLRSVMHP